MLGYVHHRVNEIPINVQMKCPGKVSLCGDGRESFQLVMVDFSYVLQHSTAAATRVERFEGAALRWKG